jgi:hypothetical protein
LEPHFEKVHDIGHKGLKNFALLFSFKLMEKKGICTLNHYLFYM